MATTLMTSYINGIKSGVSLIRSAAFGKGMISAGISSTAKLSQIVTAIEQFDTAPKYEAGCGFIYDMTASASRSTYQTHKMSGSLGGYNSFLRLTIPYGENSYTGAWNKTNYYTGSIVLGNGISSICNNIYKIGSYRFCNIDQNGTNRVTIYAPNCSIIGSNAFSNTTVSFSNSSALYSCKSIAHYAFYTNATQASYDTKIASLNMPYCSYIGINAFYGRFNTVSAWTIGTHSTVSQISILTSAFYSCTNTGGFTIGHSNINSLSISDYAFCYCLSNHFTIANSIPNITIGSSAFLYCFSLFDIKFATNISKINNYTFAYCNNISNIPTNFPNLSSIGSYGFGFCSNISSSFYLNTSNSVYISSAAFMSCSQLPGFYVSNASITCIGSSAFYHCDNLKNFYANTTISNISAYAFAYCSSLTNFMDSYYSSETDATNRIKTGSGIIDTYAFAYCSNWNKNLIISGFSIIGDYAFYNCKKLLSLAFYTTNSLNINSYAFYSCNSVSSIVFGTTIGSISIGNNAFENTRLNYSKTTIYVCDYIYSSIWIGSRAFYSAFTQPSSCTIYIGYSIINNSVPTLRYIGLGSDAFAYNSYISNVIFGNNTTSSTLMSSVRITLNSSAFAYCSRLVSMRFACGAVPTANANVKTNILNGTPFNGTTIYGSAGSIYVPSSLYNTWKTATNWTTLSGKLAPYTVY